MKTLFLSVFILSSLLTYGQSDSVIKPKTNQQINKWLDSIYIAHSTPLLKKDLYVIQGDTVKLVKRVSAGTWIVKRKGKKVQIDSNIIQSGKKINRHE